MLNKRRTFKRLGYKLKRVLKTNKPEPEPKKVATLADIRNKLEHYEKTQGPANFTGPRAVNTEKAENPEKKAEPVE